MLLLLVAPGTAKDDLPPDDIGNPLIVLLRECSRFLDHRVPIHPRLGANTNVAVTTEQATIRDVILAKLDDAVSHMDESPPAADDHGFRPACFS